MKKYIFIILFFAFISNIEAQTTTQIPYEQDIISIDLPDIVLNNTILKRKAFASDMDYNLMMKTVTLRWVIKFYSNDGGDYGENIGQVVPSYSKITVASNLIAVNPSTGEPLVKDSLGHYPVNWIGQFDFFNNIGKNTSIKVHDVIRQFGLRITDWDKK